MKAYVPLLEKYSRQADRYDRRWNRTFGQALLGAAVEAVPWTDDVERILDVGCGTGSLEEAIFPLPRPIGVVGVDASIAMLRQAQAKLNGADHGRLCWGNALAEALPFRSGSFDAVVCANSFHYYRRPWQVLQEFHRVLRPDGWMVLADWCADYLACKLGHWALRVADRTGLHRYGLERCYSMEECSGLLTQAGFRIDSARRFEIDWQWGVMVYRART